MVRQSEHYYAFGPFRLEPDQGRLLRDGLVVPLTPKIFATLVTLARQHGQLVTKEALMQELWPDAFVEEANLTFNVSVLRKALGETADGGSYIETAPKRGYRFRVPVKEFQVEHEFRRLAVLPFSNAGSQAGSDYFVQGMHEALISELAQIGGLRVLSRTSSLHCVAEGRSLPEFARALHFDVAVEGSVCLDRDRARIDIRLLDAPEDRHICARSYECHLGDVLSVQRELACAIARQIQVTLTRQEEDRLSRPQPIRPEALAACLRGRYYWHYFTPAGMQQAIAHFQQALELAPDYAQAWAGLCSCHVAMAVQSMVAPGPAAREGREAARRVLELDPLMPDAHLAVAAAKLFFDWDWPAVERAIASALELSPGHSMAHSLFTHYAAARGWGDHAIASARRALELDPLSAVHNHDLGWAYLLNGDYEQAREQLLTTLGMEFPFPLAYVSLGQVYLQQGNFPAALDAIQKSLPPDGCGPPPVMAMLGHARAAAGDVAGARQSLRALDEMSARGYVSPYDRAVVYAGLSEPEEALGWLERAFEDRSPRVIWLKAEPAFQGLRTLTRFENLGRRLETSQAPARAYMAPRPGDA